MLNTRPSSAAPANTPADSSLAPSSLLHDEPAAPSAGAAFDVCEGALALRALGAVNGAVAIAALMQAGTPENALAVIGPALLVSLPAALLWLMTVCLLRKVLDRVSGRARLTGLMALGAAAALLAVWPWVTLGLIDNSPVRWAAVALAGAALALPLGWWLQMRELGRIPADAGARLAELQSRIRPHFLFNTLNTAIALVRSDPARAESVLEHLSELFRVALEAPGAGTSTVGAELALARRYLDIEQLRFGDRLHVEWQLDPEADSASLPALVLQPLLENAVRHGVEPSETGGTVRVRTRARGGRAEIGIDNPLPTHSAPGHGVALANVRERLRLLYDLDSSFEAGPHGQRWRVRIVVPLTTRSAA